MSNRIAEIRKLVEGKKGERIRLYVIGDRNRILDAIGVLDGVYTDVFTVNIEKSESYKKRYCYKYSEILTQRVRILPAVND